MLFNSSFPFTLLPLLFYFFLYFLCLILSCVLFKLWSVHIKAGPQKILTHSRSLYDCKGTRQPWLWFGNKWGKRLHLMLYFQCIILTVELQWNSDDRFITVGLRFLVCEYNSESLRTLFGTVGNWGLCIPRQMTSKLEHSYGLRLYCES